MKRRPARESEESTTGGPTHVSSLRVLLWDVRVGGRRRSALIERIRADVLLILGISRASSQNWSDHWQGHYHCAQLSEASGQSLGSRGAVKAADVRLA